MPKSANDKLLEQALEDALDISRITTKEREKVRRVLRNLKLKLKGRMSELPDLLKMSPSRRRTAIRKFLREADKEIAAQFSDFGEEFTATLSDLAVYEAAAAVTAINAVVGVELAKALNFNAEQARVLVSEAWISGSTVEEMINGMEEAFAREFKRIVREGYMMGETNDEIARRISGYTDREGAYHAGIAEGVARKSAERMVRTATMGIANAVREEVFRSNEEVIKGREWLATLDTRTCLECAARDGKAWDMEGRPIGEHSIPYAPPPKHRNCRCVLTPVLRSWEELGIYGFEDFDEGTRASMDGQVSGSMTFEDWFETLDAARQEAILGKGRYELYKSGKISFSDLVDQNGRGLTVEELYKKNNVKKN